MTDYSHSQLNISEKNTINWRAGRFNVSLQTDIDEVHQGVALLYPHSLISSDEIIDFHIEIKSSRPVFKQSKFIFNGKEPFSPLPYAHALPLLEWGLNWCVTNHFYESLVIHAAVVEKNGKAIIFPGAPGSGKSTLCAGLVAQGGWRLLSDELALVDLNSSELLPNPRPISLKNQSIDIIQQLSSDLVFTAKVDDTIKGTVAHARPPKNSADRYAENAQPVAVVFPKYMASNAPNMLQEISSGHTFMQLVENSFNYHILGLTGFKALGKLMDNVNCFEYQYDGNLQNAINQMDEIVAT